MAGTRGVASVYLCAYNAAQAAGWLLVLARLAAAAGGERAAGPAAMAAVAVLQAAAGVEVLHAACGLTKGALSAAVMQWVGRSHCLYAVVLMESRLANGYDAVSAASVGQNAWRNGGRLAGDMALLFPAMLMAAAWALSEVVRYPHYLATTVASMRKGGAEVPAWLEWLRYSVFIPLYPIGLAAESASIAAPRASPSAPATDRPTDRRTTRTGRAPREREMPRAVRSHTQQEADVSRAFVREQSRAAVLCLYGVLSLPAGREVAASLSVRLPNSFNVAFDYSVFVRVLLVAYVPLWLNLYSYMFKQRRRKLSAQRAKVKAS